MEQEREHWNNKYKESLGIDYWDYEYKGLTMKQLAKDTIMTRVILYDILSSQAKKRALLLVTMSLPLRMKMWTSLYPPCPRTNLKGRA